jgi:hypothetical protein
VPPIKAFSISTPLLVFGLFCGRATASEVRVIAGDWVLAADASAGTFSVDAGPLGRLLQNGRFWVREESQLRPVNGWSIRAVKDALVIRASEPKMEWKLSVLGDVLHVASTDYRSLDVGPHDTRVLAIHPLLGHPQTGRELPAHIRVILGAERQLGCGQDVAERKIADGGR